MDSFLDFAAGRLAPPAGNLPFHPTGRPELRAASLMWAHAPKKIQVHPKEPRSFVNLLSSRFCAPSDGSFDSVGPTRKARARVPYTLDN